MFYNLENSPSGNKKTPSCFSKASLSFLEVSSTLDVGKQFQT